MPWIAPPASGQLLDTVALVDALPDQVLLAGSVGHDRSISRHRRALKVTLTGLMGDFTVEFVTRPARPRAALRDARPPDSDDDLTLIKGPGFGWL